MAISRGSDNSESNGAIMGFQAMLLTAADKLSDSIDRKKLTKLLGLNLGIAAADIITISSGLIGFGTLGEASGITIIILSVAGVIYGNYEILKQEKVKPKKPTPTPEYYIDALNKHREIKTFEEKINLAIDQIVRLQKKNKKFLDILPQAFDYSDITCNKFYAAIEDAEKILFENIQDVINKLDIFDEEVYRPITEKTSAGVLSQKIEEDKLEVYNEYVTSINAAAEDNEQILMMLDRLLLRISDINRSDSGQRNQMADMIDDLIEQLKHYKK